MKKVPIFITPHMTMRWYRLKDELELQIDWTDEEYKDLLNIYDAGSEPGAVMQNVRLMIQQMKKRNEVCAST
jgi:hypothetical protein